MADDVTRTYVPLSEIMAQELWPTDFFGSADFDFLNGIAYVDGQIFDDELGTNIVLQLEVVEEVSFELPFTMALIVGSGPVHFTLTGDDRGFVSWTDAELIKLRLPRDVFVPLVTGADQADPDPTRFVEIAFPVGVNFDSFGNFDLAWPAEGRTPLALERCMIGNTGIIISASDVLVRMSDNQALPDAALAAGVDPGFRGLYIGAATVELPEGLMGAIPAGTELLFEHCFIGTGGFTGKLRTVVGGGVTGSLFGAEFTFESLALEIEQNALTKFELAGSIRLALFANPLHVVVSVDLDGNLLVNVAESGGLVQLNQPGVFQFTIDQIEFELRDRVLFARTSGTLTPTFQPAGVSINWPGIKLQKLEFDSQGHVSIAGAWLDLGDQVTISLFGFLVEITRLGFGTTDDGENWIGFNGGVKLMEGVPAGASVEGLRILWGGSRGTRLTFEGVGVELEIPNVLKIAGKVSLSPESSEFKGAVRVVLPAISFELEGQFVAGSVETAGGGHVLTYAVYLETQLPAGIPLGATGLALYGMAGLFAHNREPNKLPDQGWYRNPDFSNGWFTTPPVGITDVGSKWRAAQGHMAFGAGIILGTLADNGYVFNGRLLLALVFPGPVILLDGMANLFKKRTALGEGEPNFHALIVIDPGHSFTAGLDAQYKFGSDGELLDIRGSAEAFFDFNNPANWHLYLGVKDPAANRIRARLFQLFDVNAYFMLDARQLALGAGCSYSKTWGFKHLNVSLAASLEGAAVVSWHPAHFKGSLSVAGSAGLHAFSIGISVRVGAEISADVFDPFGLDGKFKVGINLPWPLPDVSATVHLEWKEEQTRFPALPVPVREASIEHIKSANTWRLERGVSLISDEGLNGEFEFERPGDQPLSLPGDREPPPTPRIPADSKVAITFTRPVNDPKRIAQYQNTVDPEIIGDPVAHNVTYTVQYELVALELQKWAPGDSSTDGAARWVKVREGGESVATQRKLFGAFQAGSTERDAGHSEQNKLFVNALTPFDYTAERSRAWQEAFLASQPGFPCPLAVPELSARFTQPIGTSLLAPIEFSEPEFSVVAWSYGGFVMENDDVISTVLGPLDRGATFGDATGSDGEVLVTIVPPPGEEDVLIRVGTPKRALRTRSSFDTSLVGEAANPLTLADGVTVTSLSGRAPSAPLAGANRVVERPGGAALEITSRVEITVPVTPLYVEIDVFIDGQDPSGFEAFSVDENGREGSHLRLESGSTTTRFRPNKTAPLSRVVVRRTSAFPLATKALLTRIAFRGPLSAKAIVSGGSLLFDEPANGLFHISAAGLSEIQILGHAYEGFTLLELALPGDEQAIIRHAQDSLSRLSAEDPLFDPESDYRLVVTTRRTSNGSSGPLQSSLSFVHHAYFHVVGPPGVEAPDQPPDQPAQSQTGVTGLSDLRLYIEQTLPPTIPPAGGKLLLPRAFYRGYDVAVQFNEAYLELLYLTARRALSTRLFDVEGRAVRGENGRVAIPTPSWERSRQQSVKESVALWVALVNGGQCRPDDLPPFDTDTLVRNQALAAPSEDLVLAAETLHQARLVPVLLHESFIEPLPDLIADGSAHRLERWVAEGASRWEIDSETISGTGSTPSVVYFVKQTLDATAALVYDGALGQTEGKDSPSQWSDVRASVVVRWSAGIVGLELRRAGSGDLVRFTLDRATNTRSLIALVGGTLVALANDSVPSFPDAGTDIAIMIECVGDRVQVFTANDAAPIFDVSGAPVTPGGLGLYVEHASDARFTEVRVDDLRDAPSTAFVFDFVTSKYTNFHHHLQSFPDRLARGAVALLTSADLDGARASAVPVPAAAGDGLGDVTDAERRAFEGLETKVLGMAALRPPENIEVLRVSAADAPLAVLLRSPEPLLWERTLVSVSSSENGTALAAPGKLKLTDVSFGAAADERVIILVRSRMSLAHCKLEWRPVTSSGDPPAWSTYFAFGETEPELADGMQVHVLAVSPASAPEREPGTTQRFVASSSSAPSAHFAAPGVELRLLAADGKSVLHQRQFATSDEFTPFPMRAVRKLDGTALLLFADEGTAVPAALRLDFKFTRAVGKEPLPFRQGGSETPERASLDVVLAAAE